MTKYYSARQPDRCPACHSERVREILYGYPLPDAMDAANRDELVLGGCEIDESNPSWRCLDCHADIHQEDLRRGDVGNRRLH